MARAKKMNPEGTLLSFGGDAVRLERGPNAPEPGSKTVWILFQRRDTTDDDDTTYTYVFDEVRRFDEDELGEPPQAALDAAGALADDGE